MRLAHSSRYIAPTTYMEGSGGDDAGKQTHARVGLTWVVVVATKSK